jgi:hypothetical protein
MQSKIKDVDGRDKKAFTPVFNGLCPAMTGKECPSNKKAQVRF